MWGGDLTEFLGAQYFVVDVDVIVLVIVADLVLGKNKSGLKK